jgi:hypothetical protein
MKVADIFALGGHGGGHGHGCGCGGYYNDDNDGYRRGRRGRDREEILELLGIPIIGEGGSLLSE